MGEGSGGDTSGSNLFLDLLTTATFLRARLITNKSPGSFGWKRRLAFWTYREHSVRIRNSRASQHRPLLDLARSRKHTVLQVLQGELQVPSILRWRAPRYSSVAAVSMPVLASNGEDGKKGAHPLRSSPTFLSFSTSLTLLVLFFQVDLYKECPFWYENTFCMNRDCSVETAEEVSCFSLSLPSALPTQPNQPHLPSFRSP